MLHPLEVGQLAAEAKRQQQDGTVHVGRGVQRVVDEPGDVGPKGPVVAAVAPQVEDRHRPVAEPACKAIDKHFVLYLYMQGMGKSDSVCTNARHVSGACKSHL
jgi:hypothetical protein